MNTDVTLSNAACWSLHLRADVPPGAETPLCQGFQAASAGRCTAPCCGKGSESQVEAVKHLVSDVRPQLDRDSAYVLVCHPTFADKAKSAVRVMRASGLEVEEVTCTADREECYASLRATG